MIHEMTHDEQRTLAAQLALERQWTLWIKRNYTPWDTKHMQCVYTMQTVAEMWQVLNNIPRSCVGVCNMFIMHTGVAPLWENNGSLFEHGGCWSVVIRKHAWRDVMNQLVMSLMGETTFGASVRGACIVPVAASHVICKIWCTQRDACDSKALVTALHDFGASGARFKEFVR